MLEKSFFKPFQHSSRAIKSYHMLAGSLLALLITSCACSDNRRPEAGRNEIAAVTNKELMQDQKAVSAAIAHLNPVKGNYVRGKVTFTKVPEGIKIVADVEGLSPGKHGFHIHEHGDCGGNDASAAGAHFNPTHAQHGGPNSPIRHVGDLGNLVADDNGHAHYERVDRVISFEGENSIIGRSVIVHSDEDDYMTQPAGASGAKISCGIIEVVSSPSY